MATPIIEISGLGKRYNLSHRNRPDSLKTYLRSLIGLDHNEPHGSLEEFWALRDIDLTLDQGQCLALIGENGSGKSTLLKILSRVTRPTTGCIRVCGKVASLLEVGTGFHPELTGRENIFLNGAMLGCSERGIMQRFDAIVQFSGVERFLDTPVKHYSSGMYIRLAYSVAAHVDSDILVIDEVLAVGDSEFQQKCIDHLSKIHKRGQSAIFVSHNTDLVRRLATHIAKLKDGQLTEYSSATASALDAK